MKLKDLKKFKIPDSPGVYLFKSGRRILYIGKATSLKGRVRSYFSKDLVETRGPLLADMVFKAESLSFVKTDSVLEALILEANLIRKHQPIANTKEKDDKSFNYVVMTDEDFPRILIIRGRDLERSAPVSVSVPTYSPVEETDKKSPEGEKIPEEFKVKDSFGPFPYASELRSAMKIVRKIFPFRDTCEPGTRKPCFNRQIDLCPGVCSGEISKEDYAGIIKNIRLFFEGKKKRLMEKLRKEMNEEAKKENFEKATDIRRTLFSLLHIQDIALLKDNSRIYRKLGRKISGAFRIEAYDVAHISGSANVGVMAVVEDGMPNKSEYRKFRIRRKGADDTGSLKEMLFRRFRHPEWMLPNLVAVDGGMGQKNSAERVLADKGLPVKVVAVVKNSRHRPEKILGDSRIVKENEKDILLANSEAHRFALKYHRALRDSRLA